MKCGTGWCCRHVMFIYGTDSEMPTTMVRILLGELELMLLREIELFWDGHRRVFVALMTAPCSKVTGTGKCDLYGSRPDSCRSYPTKGAFKYLTESCSFFNDKKHGSIEALEAVPSMMVAERILLGLCGKSSVLYS